jgi:hypothetical protein
MNIVELLVVAVVAGVVGCGAACFVMTSPRLRAARKREMAAMNLFGAMRALACDQLAHACIDDPWERAATVEFIKYGLNAPGFLANVVQQSLAERVAFEAGVDPQEIWPGSWATVVELAQREFNGTGNPSTDTFHSQRAARLRWIQDGRPKMSAS